MSELKEEVKAQSQKHILVWSLFALSVVVIIGVAGYFVYNKYENIESELSAKYSQTVAAPKKGDEAFSKTDDNDLKEIDREMNLTSTNDFGDSTLNDNNIGL
jgi:hypothetical protein